MDPGLCRQLPEGAADGADVLERFGPVSIRIPTVIKILTDGTAAGTIVIENPTGLQ